MEPSRTPEYHVAKGPEALKQAFNNLWEDPALRMQPQNILYSLGQQLSLIIVDFNIKPVKFSYADVTVPFARPAPQTIKNAITDFCKENKENLGEEISDDAILKKHFFDQTLQTVLVRQDTFVHIPGAKMNIDQEKNPLTDEQQKTLQKASSALFTQLSSMTNNAGEKLLPAIKIENVSKLLLAQAQLKLHAEEEQKRASVSATDYGQKGKYPGLFDKEVPAKTTPALTTNVTPKR